MCYIIVLFPIKTFIIQRAMSTSSIDIAGLDKSTVLNRLWQHSKTASFFSTGGISASPLSIQKLKNALKDGYVDYLCGRVIKTDFSGSALSPYLYDRDNGQGAMSRIIDDLRQESGEVEKLVSN